MVRKLIAASVAAALAAGTPTQVMAGAFGIGTQSGSGTGNAYSGGAAGAEDASVVWTNPAAMSMLPQGKHAHVAGHLLRPSFKFQDNGSTIPAALGTGNGGDGGGWALVPNAYFAMSLSNNMSVGLGVNAPFGLKTDYDNGWSGQRIALKSEIKTININPSISYKVSPSVAIGAGVSLQWIEAELTNASAFGTANLSADDIGYGFNFGVAVQASPSTRFGIHYRSSIRYTLEGNASFSGSPTSNARVKADLRVPDSVSLSMHTAVSPKWDLMADLTWTKWSTIKGITPICEQASFIVCTGAGAPLLGAGLPTNWRDTWRVGVGANYKHSPAWKFRFGLAYDQTPTNDVDRTARLPDQDRVWVAFGAQYTVSKNGKIDFGYAHEFVRDARVNTTVFGSAFRQTGHFEDKADILTISYSHTF